MKNNMIETLIGAVVIIVAMLFFLHAYQIHNSGKVSTKQYNIIARFQNVDGITKGSSVKVSGIVVGEVDDLSLDKSSYLAILTMNIDNEIKIPKDSSASIISSGMLGGKYISISPGAEEEMLENNGVIKFTQSSVNLESILGKFMLSNGSKGAN